MRSGLIVCMIATAAMLGAQESAPAPTADELMEKSIQATGGREAASKVTSLIAKGTFEISAMGVSAPTEMYAKAPDKRYTITAVDGYGDVKNGYDGTIGWSSEPQNGLVELKGPQLAQVKRESQFNGDLRWKELYPKAEVTGKEKVGGKDCWVLKLTPAEGKPVTRYVDAATFLMVKAITVAYTPEGEVEMPIEFSDYKDIGSGMKMPHTIKVTFPGIGEMSTKFKEYQINAEIDDAKFAKPKN